MRPFILATATLVRLALIGLVLSLLIESRASAQEAPRDLRSRARVVEEARLKETSPAVAEPTRVAAIVSPMQPRKNYNQVLEPYGRIYNGAGQDEAGFQSYYNSVSTASKPCYLMVYTNLNDVGLSGALWTNGGHPWYGNLASTLNSYNKLVILQIGLSLDSGENTAAYLSQIASGSYDNYINRFIQGLQSLNRPALVRIGYELNGSWHQYSGPAFAEAYRYIVNKFRAQQTVTIANVWDQSADAGLVYGQWYPGDSYVDWWGINVWGSGQFADPSVLAFLDSANAHGKPVMIGETTPRYYDVSANPTGTWTDWFVPYANFIHDHPGVKASSYINWNWTQHSLSGWGNGILSGTVLTNWNDELSNATWSHAPFTAGAPTAPLAPTLSSPASGATNQLTTLTLTWSAVSGATSYRLQVSTSPDFATTFFDDSSLAQVSRSVGVLAANTTYYWRVKAKNAIGQSPWSSTWNFTTGTGISVPPTPALASPANGATGQSTSPTLSWNASTGATSYRLQVSTSQSFGTMVFDDSTIAGSSRQVGLLLNETTYYWRVRAKNSAGNSTYSGAWSFTTTATPAGVPSVPVPLSPGAGKTAEPLTVILMWQSSAGATTYRVQLSAAQAFGTTVADDSTVTTTSRQVGPLLNGTTYYWRVRAKNSVGSSEYSSAWSFTTIVQAPTQVSLVRPTNGATIRADTVRLMWRKATPDVTSYWLERSEDSLFTSPTVDSTLTDTSRVVRSLLGGCRYWWRVRAKNAAGWGTLSVRRNFAVALTSADEKESVPIEFSLGQNFPNPFNPTTTIGFTIPHACLVTLRLYDLMGRQVATLVDDVLSAGPHDVRFEAGNLAGGIYFYQLHAANYAQTRKLVLLK